MKNDTLCLLKIEPNGSIYKENKMGARIEPWGTPQVNPDLDDEHPSTQTEKVLLFK